MRRLGLRWIKLIVSLLLVTMITFFSTSAQYFDSRFLRDSLRERFLQGVIGQSNLSRVTEQQATPQVNGSERGQVALCLSDPANQQLEKRARLEKINITNQGISRDFVREERQQFREESDMRYRKVQTEKGLTNNNDERKGKKKKTSKKHKKSSKEKSEDDDKKQKQGYDSSDSGNEEEADDKQRKDRSASPEPAGATILKVNNSAGQPEVEAAARDSWKELGKKPLPRKVLLVSTFRSGSSFLGQLLATAQKETFYSYEPLHGYVSRSNNSEGGPGEALQYLQEILDCRWDAHPQQVTHLSQQGFWRKWNQRLTAACEPADLCDSAQFVARVCRNAALHVAKVVRLSLHDAQLLLDDPRNAGMKVIHLMRDPRGSLNSRWSLYWCLNPECRDSETVCRQQLADLKLVPELQGSYPSRYKFVLYEDLSLRPDKVVKELWRFLNLKPNRRTLALLARNTKTPSTQPYSTLRNSPCHTFSWRKQLNYTMLTKVQETCKDVIWGLGMRLFASEEEYRNLSVSVMLKEGPSPACGEAGA